MIRQTVLFILHYRVMQNETDDKIAVSTTRETQERFPDFRSYSYDKGFHSQENQRLLAEMLDRAVLPREGRLSAINKEVENSEGFKEARRNHSAVESSINALGWVIMVLICVRTMGTLDSNVMWRLLLWPVISKYWAICCSKKSSKNASAKHSSYPKQLDPGGQRLFKIRPSKNRIKASPSF